jgi:hypothetical protein
MKNCYEFEANVALSRFCPDVAAQGAQKHLRRFASLR